MNDNLIKKADIDNLINLLKLDIEIMEDDERDYKLMQRVLFRDIERNLNSVDANVANILSDITDYGEACRSEALHIGVKVGMKLIQDINGM